MSKRAWVVHRGRQFAAIYDGRGRTVAERVPLDMAERIAMLPILEAERGQWRCEGTEVCCPRCYEEDAQ